MTIEGIFVDINKKQLQPVQLTVEKGLILSIQEIPNKEGLPYLMPGFIDAHVHVESSMLVPSEFARLAVVHGTVATISDPHEIANVCGMQGVEYMIENGKQVPFHFFFGAPSCVPATPFETAGGEINAADIDNLMARPEILYLAEMMNWPGTVHRDPVVMEKIRIAQKYGKPIDGHAPGLMGELAEKYVSAGPSTDHECFTYAEALGKIKLGMKISIREGSAAKNFEALIDLIDDYPGMIMFCSDDKHPDNLAISHINELAARAVAKGKDVFEVLRAACLNPIAHYSLPLGQVREGDPADFILVKDLEKFEVLATYIKGEKVAENGKTLIPRVNNEVINNFHTSLKRPEDFQLSASGTKVRVIEALDGQLITPEIEGEILIRDGLAESNPEKDILKITVVNRYQDATPAVAFIKNFEALIDLIDDYPGMIMFCSDDKHPDNLAISHINELAARAVAKGKDVFEVLRAACLNPIAHYSLPLGQVREGDPADFILVKDLEKFEVLATYIKGEKVAENGKTLIPRVKNEVINNFHTSLKKPDDFRLSASGTKVRVIEALDGQLITPEIEGEILIRDGLAESNPDKDILKITVVNRYQNAPPAVAFIKNFGLKTGAIASSVGHDSHNIIAVGIDDESICRAVNLLIEAKGGISAVSAEKEEVLPLTVGGIMSPEDGYQVAEAYTRIDRMAKEMGSMLNSPFMTLSFMALLVIPDLKLSDKGLFDGRNFAFCDLFFGL